MSSKAFFCHLELALFSVWTACVRRRQGKGAPEKNVHGRPGFWPLQRTRLSPERAFAGLIQRPQMPQRI